MTSTDTPVDAPDYKRTVFLPTTSLPMKAGLPTAEPQWLARWARIGAYHQLRAQRKGAETFLLHDGPPYANGDIHIGHALNKILKDIVVRTQSMMGKDAPYVPGWDCHGLPIEWRVEESYRAKKQNKDSVDPIVFRKECRAYAAHWVQVQKEQFQRLGIWGEWDKPYLTMDYQAESIIVAELLKFLDNGALYRGAKPVMWSPVEKTALAEAEIEYEDIVSTQVDVAFEITDSPVSALVGAYAVIWTTTPWTLPVNQAIAYGPDIDYVACHVHVADDSQSAHNPFVEKYAGKTFVIARALVERVQSRLQSHVGDEAGLSFVIGKSFKGADLAGTLARHPMHERGDFFKQPRPFLSGDFVTTDSGTGLVHLAPDHGEDDFLLCKQHGLHPVFAVEADGRYREDWAWPNNQGVQGQGSVIAPKLNAPEGLICSDLAGAGALLSARSDYRHSYPHSWRSKAKVVFRCTPQWFISMEKTQLRDRALQALDAVRFVPEGGSNRIRGMVKSRPDWVISRQRAWGAPITLFVDKHSGAVVNDRATNAKIIQTIAEEGAEAWYARPPQDFFPGFDPAQHEQVFDILDVWFDSGSTHAFVVEAREDLQGRGRADLYLEGSDQHRGWFQSSLLESCGTRGQAPYKAVMTHGFTLDGKGEKMSKSKGNTVDPLAIIKDHGADILRLWVVSTDYFEDQRIGKEILAGTVESYRKIRNTLRYLLGALADFSPQERVPEAQMPELERWVLHRMAEMDLLIRQCVQDFDFNRAFTALYQFCIQDLSAFYFDIRKDSLYCDGMMSPRRRAARTVMDLLFCRLTLWLAPFLVFTSEEVWQTRFPSEEGSVHFEQWPTTPDHWHDAGLADKWQRLRDIRSVVTGALEVDRRQKKIGSSLESAPIIFVESDQDKIWIDSVPFAEICITSSLEVRMGQPTQADGFVLEDVAGVRVSTASAVGEKCARCWMVLPDVGAHTQHPQLCGRCVTVVDL